jgi:hypothetical protein
MLRMLSVIDARRAPPDGLGSDALDRSLRGDGELLVGEIDSVARVLGAFQRKSDAAGASHRRISGGPALDVGPDTLYMGLALARVDALFDCDPPRLLNRYVRPLLKALTRAGAPAHYFGRDFVSVQHRPAAQIGFAHDAASDRAVVEAYVPIARPLWSTPRTQKEPILVEVDLERLRAGIIEAYGAVTAVPAVTRDARDLEDDPQWTVVMEDAIGAVCAGPDRHGVLRLGGEFMASRDAVAALERGAPIPPRATFFGVKTETLRSALSSVARSP